MALRSRSTRTASAASTPPTPQIGAFPSTHKDRFPATGRLRRPGRWAALVAVAGLAVGGTAAPGNATEANGPHATTAVLDWNAAAGRAAVAACLAPTNNPLTESRMYAMAQLAVHDAINAVRPHAEAYATRFRAPAWASLDAAVAAASHDVMVSVFHDFPEPFGQACGDQGAASVEDFYATSLADIPTGAAKQAGLAAGHRAANAVIALRAGDGSTTPLTDPTFPQGTQPGQWRFTPGAPFAFAPGWGSVRPFGLTSAGQFRSAAPHALDSTAYARDLNEIKAFGGDGLSSPTVRTPAQTETAEFWVESSPLAWNRMARNVAQAARLDPWQQARLLGLLNIALADGYISSFAQKYDQLFWRPVTAIRLADTDGNPATTADPGWTPLEQTPPIPDHDSAHAVEGGAGSMVLRQVIGRDHFPIAQCSTTLPAGCDSDAPVVHHFDTFSQAAAENSVSRIWVGFHFRWATVQGQLHGEAIGRYIANHLLQPLH